MSDDKSSDAGVAVEQDAVGATSNPHATIIDAFEVFGSLDVGRSMRAPDADEDNLTLAADVVLMMRRAGYAPVRIDLLAEVHEGADRILGVVAGLDADGIVVQGPGKSLNDLFQRKRTMNRPAKSSADDARHGLRAIIVAQDGRGPGASGCHAVGFVVDDQGRSGIAPTETELFSTRTLVAHAAENLPQARQRGLGTTKQPGIPTDAAQADACLRIYKDGVGAIAQGAYVSEQAYESNGPARYGLIGQQVPGDGVLFPPRESVPDSGADVGEPVRLSGRGSIYSVTRIGKGGAPTEFVPYQDASGNYDVAVVELTEGPRLAAMLTNDSRVRLGLDEDDEIPLDVPVDSVLRLLFVQQGHRRYHIKFRPT